MQENSGRQIRREIKGGLIARFEIIRTLTKGHRNTQLERNIYHELQKRPVLNTLKYLYSFHTIPTKMVAKLWEGN